MYANVAHKIDVVFNHEKIRILLVKFRYPICLFFFVLLLPQIKPSLLFPAFLVSLFGELIQVWSFASLDKNRTLAAHGPYSLARNPMYIGRFFLLLGGLLLMGKTWLILVFTLLYYFYMTNRIRREETTLHEIFGEEYESYCAQVNRFVPSIETFNGKTLRFFRWRLLVQNNGHWNLAGMLSSYLFFYLFTFIQSAAP